MKTDSFTPAQREAIDTDAANVLCIAGPGSGKTATTVARINRLVETGTPASDIVAITFTNAAARELEERIERSFDGSVAVSYQKQDFPLGHVGTLHSFALRMLKEYGSAAGYGARMSIISPESAADLLQSKARSIGSKLTLQDLLKLKAEGRPPTGVRLSVDQTVIASYFDELRAAGIVDFDVLLLEFLRLLRNDAVFVAHIAGRFSHLFVDEVQDSGAADWLIYSGLRIANVFFGGDADQAIYGFRGGRPDCMRAAAVAGNMKVTALEENFRSREEICAAADRLISHNQERIAKRTISTRGVGGQVEFMLPALSEGEEIGEVARSIKLALEMGVRQPKEIAVLCRTNAVAHAFQKTLVACGIPVAVAERDELPRDWPFVRALIELLVNPENDTLAFFYCIALYKKLGASDVEARAMAHSAAGAAGAAGRSINDANLNFPRGINAVGCVGIAAKAGASMEARMILAQLVKQVGAEAPAVEFALALASMRHREAPALIADGVEVCTIHAAKGREWDTVYIVGCEDEAMPGKRSDIEEERRLLFVAVTRAREQVYLSYAESRAMSWGAILPRTPSRFLKELAG